MLIVKNFSKKLSIAPLGLPGLPRHGRTIAPCKKRRPGCRGVNLHPEVRLLRRHFRSVEIRVLAIAALHLSTPAGRSRPRRDSRQAQQPGGVHSLVERHRLANH